MSAGPYYTFLSYFHRHHSVMAYFSCARYLLLVISAMLAARHRRPAQMSRSLQSSRDYWTLHSARCKPMGGGKCRPSEPYQSCPPHTYAGVHSRSTTLWMKASQENISTRRSISILQCASRVQLPLSPLPIAS
ncbi:hypothetical protein ARMSODRAFT_672707 [Armillaria solidipes]|uniref:Uncharacterized protein n=1 Tax=Armillaria solidipes TaxID=1076256 RepID=A0A2H3AR02_9AGAR|nr:hypothetical protein ARMSODRAFT_672707 [Armillaria solidipes]